MVDHSKMPPQGRGWHATIVLIILVGLAAWLTYIFWNGDVEENLTNSPKATIEEPETNEP